MRTDMSTHTGGVNIGQMTDVLPCNFQKHLQSKSGAAHPCRGTAFRMAKGAAELVAVPGSSFPRVSQADPAVAQSRSVRRVLSVDSLPTAGTWRRAACMAARGTAIRDEADGPRAMPPGGTSRRRHRARCADPGNQWP